MGAEVLKNTGDGDGLRRATSALGSGRTATGTGAWGKVEGGR